jgi:hypothetical protein
MRIVKFTQDTGTFKAGEIAEVEDQIACGAIAQGIAVPSIDHVEVKAFDPVEEVCAFDAAPETK